MKLGDVTYDWNPNVLRGAEQQKIELYTDTIQYSNNDTIRVLFKARQFNQIQGMQFTIGWNASHLSFTGIGTNPINAQFGSQKSSEGLLSVLWNDPANVVKTLSEGTVLFELKFIKNNPSTDDVITLNSSITPIEGYNAALDLHDIVLTGGYIKSDIKQPITINETNAVYPNPTTGIINVPLNVQAAEKITIALYNQLGQKLGAEKFNVVAGNNLMKIDLKKTFGATANGGYYLKISGSTLNQLIKLSLLK
jgi:hypothetical protein